MKFFTLELLKIFHEIEDSDDNTRLEDFQDLSRILNRCLEDSKKLPLEDRIKLNQLIEQCFVMGAYMFIFRDSVNPDDLSA